MRESDEHAGRIVVGFSKQMQLPRVRFMNGWDPWVRAGLELGLYSN